MAERPRVVALVGFAILLAACSAGPQNTATPTTRTTLGKILGEDGCRDALRYADAHPGLPDVDSVIAASCTPTALSAAIAARDPSLSVQQVAAKEQETAAAACQGNANLTLCVGGS